MKKTLLSLTLMLSAFCILNAEEAQKEEPSLCVEETEQLPISQVSSEEEAQIQVLPATKSLSCNCPKCPK